MNLLLPHRFKKTGIVMAVLGFAFWLLMQKGAITLLLNLLLNQDTSTAVVPSFYHTINAVVATISFFSFLGGMYCIAFSKEKVEDEMIQKVRLDSFQFAALVQLLLIIGGMLLWAFLGNGNEKEELLLLLTSILLVFWFSFILRFNYVLHARMR